MLPSRHCNQNDAGWHFDNSYARQPHEFFARLPPVPVRAPRLVAFNPVLAQSLGLNPHVLEGAPDAAARIP